jgi:hypothetical protein
VGDGSACREQQLVDDDDPIEPRAGRVPNSVSSDDPVFIVQWDLIVFCVSHELLAIHTANQAQFYPEVGPSIQNFWTYESLFIY